MKAASFGDIFNVKKMISQANKLNDAGNTALIYACSNGSIPCIKVLLDAEDLRHRNKLGLSGVDCAFRARRFDACGILEEYCFSKGYMELKPKITTTKQEERAAVEHM